ncbi:hypothetical protein [Oryzibacter oryziterrae]|uniref:hypothetical protein n=1 Tax=Oryzibacter oryziterrae TaxID=2766474 RepID=UPI001F387BA0|nr:hypothetical protein [Oryzibacter oryziterrae]
MSFEVGKRFAILAVLSASLAACSSMGPTANDDDPETEVPNPSIGRALMEGVGAVPARQKPINYTPRAPLVVPPSTTTLVAPEAPNQVASLPNWPDDNDLARARMLRESQAREDARDGDAAVPSGELMAGALPTKRTGHVRTPGEERQDDKPLLPHQIGQMQSSGIDGTGVYGPDGTPRRRALVEPPVAYLQPAPGVPVTTETPEDNQPKPSFWNRMKFW